MDMTVIERTGERIHLELSGRMDTAGVEKNEPRFFALFAPHGLATIVDLTKVTLLTSMGLRLVIGAAKTARSKGFALALVVPPGPVRDVLDGAAIGELVPIAADAAAARELLAGTDRVGRG
jgi:anti-anti-sigma factor